MTTLLGTHATSFDARPQERVDARLHGGNLKHYRDAIEIGDTDNDDVTIFFKFNIDEVPASIKYAHDDLTSGTLELGLYKKNSDGTYTAVDADCFASALALGGGAVALTEVLYEAAATNIANAKKAMWEWAGLSTRPAYGELYLGITHTAGTGADGTFLLEATTVE